MPETHTDYKINPIHYADDGTMQFTVIFLEGSFSVQPEEDINGNFVNVRRYRRPLIQALTPRPQTHFNSLLKFGETVIVVRHTANFSLQRHLTIPQLIRALNPILIQDLTRQPVPSRKVIAADR